MSNYLIAALVFVGIALLCAIGAIRTPKGSNLWLVGLTASAMIALMLNFVDMDQAKLGYHDQIVLTLHRLDPRAELGDVVTGSQVIFWISVGGEKRILACVPDPDHCVIYVPQMPAQ